MTNKIMPAQFRLINQMLSPRKYEFNVNNAIPVLRVLTENRVLSVQQCSTQSTHQIYEGWRQHNQLKGGGKKKLQSVKKYI